MKIKEILQTTDHRPWKMPTEEWKYYQEWNDAVFLHWQVELAELRKFVPPELEIDLYDGKAWVSVVAFTMQKIRPKNLPPFPPVSDFHEINIRTYVKNNNKTGVYFLSIEGGTGISCRVARTLSELPYRYSGMKREECYYNSINDKLGDRLEIHYNIGGEISHKTGLDLWLTERYALFQDTRTAINEFEIHHIPWPVYTIELKKREVHYPRFSNLLKGAPHLVHYSPGVQVIAWDKIKTQRTIETGA
ncbi:YqjF family protein [Sinomicrobium sp. M5D2P9]